METCLSSDLQTSSKAICARPAKLCSITMLSDGSNAGTVIVYDNATTNSGTVIHKMVGKTSDVINSMTFNVPVEAVKGLYVSVSGTGASFIATFSAM